MVIALLIFSLNWMALFLIDWSLNKIRRFALKFKLNWSNASVKVFNSPNFLLIAIILEQVTLQICESLLDNWFWHSLSDFCVHHGNKGHCAGNPLIRILLKISNAAHYTSESFFYQNTSIHSQTVAVLTIKVGGEGASSFIAKVMALSHKFGCVFSLCSTLFQLSCAQIDKELFCLYFSYLHVAVRVTIQ